MHVVLHSPLQWNAGALISGLITNGKLSIYLVLTKAKQCLNQV